MPLTRRDCLAALALPLLGAPPDTFAEIDRLWAAYRATRDPADRAAFERGARLRLRARWRRAWPGPLADGHAELAAGGHNPEAVRVFLGWSFDGQHASGTLAAALLDELGRLRDLVAARRPDALSELQVGFEPAPGVPVRPGAVPITLAAYVVAGSP